MEREREKEAAKHNPKYLNIVKMYGKFVETTGPLLFYNLAAGFLALMT
jgi:hypothetical protein